MVDFSSVNLQITTGGDKAALKTLDVIDQRGQDVARRVSTAMGTQSEAATRHIGMATRKIAFEMENVARTSSEFIGRPMASLIAHGSNIAFMFGAAGPIVGAIGITGLAIYELFQRARREMEATRKKFIDEMRVMVNAGDIPGLTDRARTLELGTPAGRYEDGLRALRPKLAAAEAAYKAVADDWNYRMTTIKKHQLDEIRKKVAPLQAEYDAITAAILDPSTAVRRPGSGMLPVRSEAEAPSDKMKKPGGMSSDILANMRMVLPEMRQIGDEAKTYAQLVLDQEHALQLEYARSTTTAERKLAILKEIARIEVERRGSGIDVGGAKPADLPAPKKGEIDAWAQKMAGVIDHSVTTIIGDAVYNAFASAFSGRGLGGIFESFGKFVLAGIGRVMVQMGEVYLEYSGIMAKLQAFLYNPVTAGWAAAAIGIALIALGSALGSIGGGGGGGGGGGMGTGQYGQIIDRGVINPQMWGAGANANVASKAPVTLNMTVIGKNDPRAQREIMELIDQAQRRGSTRG